MVLNIDTSIAIAIAGGITSIGAAIIMVRKTFKSVSDKFKDNLKQEIEADIKKNIVEPMYQGAITEYHKDFELLKERIDTLSNTFENQANSILLEYRKMNQSSFDFRISTLKGLIVQSHCTYTQLGFISPMVLSTLEDIYETYTELGGNHFVGDLMEQIRALPRTKE